MKPSKKNILRSVAALGAGAALSAVAVLLLIACANPAVSPSTLSGQPAEGEPAATTSPVEAAESGILRLLLKDFPLQDKVVSNLWVTIVSVQVCGETTGWQQVFDSPGGAPYDLLQLVQEPALLSTAQLPADLYTQVRLVLGEKNLITIADEGSFALRVPSGQQTGIKIVGDFEIREGYQTSLLLDFDAQQSVKITGSGRYQLRPTIRIEEVSYSAVENRAPYPVTGPTTEPVFQRSAAPTFQLDIAAPAGEPDDPDGDRVYFRSSLVPSGLETFFGLDEDSGLVSFDPGAPAGSYEMRFWSEDEHGASTIATPYVVTFTFEEAKAVAYDVAIQLYNPTTGPAGATTAYCDLWLYDSSGAEKGQVTAAAGWPGLELTLDSGTYYVKVTGQNAAQEGPYAVAAVLQGESVPLFTSALTSNTDGDEGLGYEDDGASVGNVPSDPVPLALGGGLNRYLAPGETDWVKLALP